MTFILWFTFIIQSNDFKHVGLEKIQPDLNHDFFSVFWQGKYTFSYRSEITKGQVSRVKNLQKNMYWLTQCPSLDLNKKS